MNIKKIIFLTLNVLITFHTLKSGPYQYRRIILTNRNKIIKTIDLISDIHVPIHEMVRKPSQKRRALLNLDEKTAFTTAERTLLITLRTLAQQNKPLDLLWEEPQSSSQEFGKKPQIAEWQPAKLNDQNSVVWLLYGHRLKNEFDPAKNLSVVYKNSDTYRITPPEYNPVILTDVYSKEILKASNLSDVPVKDILSVIGRLLDADTSPAIQDLNNIKKYQYKDYYDQLESFWDEDKQSIVEPFYNYLNDIITKYPSITAKKFKKIIKKENTENTIGELQHDFFVYLPDTEFLIKLFATPKDHSIVYAGGAHCDFLATVLIEDFDGKEIINVGTKSELATQLDPRVNNGNSLFIPVLSPRTWTYLAQNPTTSFNIFKSRGPVINLAQQDLWNEYIKIRDTLAYVSASEEYSKEQDLNVVKTITSFYAKASKTYIDFINTRDGLGKTLLFYAVEKNLPLTTQYLLAHDARVNIQDTTLNTPLHYATLPIIMRLLLAHGARIDIKNNAYKTAVEEAQEKGDTSLSSALVRFKRK